MVVFKGVALELSVGPFMHPVVIGEVDTSQYTGAPGSLKTRDRIKDAGYALVILDPTYKLLGAADENSATDISAMLNAVEGLSVTTGAAVAMAGHFSKGNASLKETIDRISGSGVFARDPDSLLIFTKHEVDGAFTFECVLRNFEPISPFVVKWNWPLFERESSLDPKRLKHQGGRPAKYTADDVLKCLGNLRLTTTEWKERCETELGLKESRFFDLRKELEEGGKIIKSTGDEKWERIRPNSENSGN